MWEDMGLYWAWRGSIPDSGCPPTPTQKRILYADVDYCYPYLNGDRKGELVSHKLAIGVWDDNKYTKMNRDYSLGEVGWFSKHGINVIVRPIT